METETLRPEFQHLAPHPETPRHESLEPSNSQLKQEPTVNHHQPETHSDAPSATPNQKSNITGQVPSPPSDDPTTEMEDISESLQDPKPSSASTDPTPQLQKQQPKVKQLTYSPARAPSETPPVSVEKPPSLDGKKVPTRCNTLHPFRPFSFPNEDGDSSDEDEDFCRYYRTMFRRKSDSEMTSPTLKSPVAVEQSKRARNTRQSNGKVQKRKAKEAVKEIPFSDPKYHKLVGPMVLRPSDIARDLATIYGREYKEIMADTTKAPGRGNERKRQRGSETPSGGNGSPHAKRLRQGNANIADAGDKSILAEAGRSTRYAKRKGSQLGSPAGERGYQASNKRQKTGGSNGTMADNDQKKMFEKHPDRKGWVVCKKCEAPVWPPNCGKHLFHCRKL